MKNHIGVLIAACMLSACGPGATPTEREIKRNLNDQFNNCKYLSVSNVKKLNGIPQENGTYVVQTLLDVDFDSIDENESAGKDWLDKSAKYKEISSQQKADQLALAHEDDDAYDQSQKKQREVPLGPDYQQQVEAIISATKDQRDQIRAKRAEVDQRAQEALIDAGLDHFDPATYSLLNTQINNLALRCTGKGLMAMPYGGITLWSKVKAAKSADELVEIMDKGGSVSLALTIPMIKTDNGWMWK